MKTTLIKREIGFGSIIIIRYPSATGGEVVLAGKYVDNAVNTSLTNNETCTARGGVFDLSSSTCRVDWVNPAAFIDGDLFVDGTIGANKIQANSIDTTQLRVIDNTYGGIPGTTLIKAGSITTNEIEANTITADDIFAGTITATEIAVGTITATEIAAGTITATEIASGTINSNLITVTGEYAITADTFGAATTGAVASAQADATTGINTANTAVTDAATAQTAADTAQNTRRCCSRYS